MSILVTLSEFKAYLGDIVDASQDTILQALLDDVEAIFVSEAGREVVGFTAAASGRVEVRDGTGSRDLFLHYPIVALTSVKLGYNSSSPDETLNVADKKVLVFGVGSRRLSRVDGCTFGIACQPRFIEVTYDHAADLPVSAKLAIQSVAATSYRRRGSEAEKSETVGNFYSHTFLQQLATEDPFWRMGVDASMRLVMA